MRSVRDGPWPWYPWLSRSLEALAEEGREEVREEAVGERKVLTGAYAAAEAVRLVQPDVVAIYPITPSTGVAERVADLCSEGKMRARLVRVESEHSAISVLMAASALGARTFSATSSQGLALMHEVLHWTAGARLPVVMVNANRGLAAPWVLGPDHQDSLSQRDTGWMQVYVASGQELLDTVVQAYRVAEEVLLPCLVCMDGFYISHTAEPLEVPSEEEVAAFLPPPPPRPGLDPNSPAAMGALVDGATYGRIRALEHRAMAEAEEAWARAEEEFARAFGRSYAALEGYRVEGAELLLLAMGTAASTARAAVDSLRDQGVAVGLVRLRRFRPFPSGALAAMVKGAARVAVLERSISPGHQGIVASEVRAALYPAPEGPEVSGFVLGMGGQDVTPEMVEEAAKAALKGEGREEVTWVGLD